MLFVALALAACGGGGTGGGPGPEGEGQGLVLVAFSANALDDVPINRRLKLTFSEAVDATTVMVTDPTSPVYGQGTGSIQIREGTAFGLTAGGSFFVDGPNVYFDPDIPGLCDLSDAGLQADTTYRVTVQGYPEELAVRNSQGQPLETTRSFEFTTLSESSPDYLEDMAPGAVPIVASSEPANGDHGVPVQDGNEVRIVFSENLDPCSVDETTIHLLMTQIGDPLSYIDAGNGHETGFSPVQDADADPYLWGTTLPNTVIWPPQHVPARVVLAQDFDETVVTITPLFGKFPENALIVVDLRFGILDFGGYPLAPERITFTTENLPLQTSTLTIDFDRTVEPIDKLSTTADVDTDRSPSRAQGWLLFTGDGDNGSDDITPSWPDAPTTCAWKLNQNGPNDFAPETSLTLNTGSTRAECPNHTDGSNAVVWEFNSFHIRSGVTVRIHGINPAIILVRGDVRIDAGGKLEVKNTGSNGTDGGDWNFVGSAPPSPTTGGRGVAGGGDGGACRHKVIDYGDDGYAGFGSPGEFTEGGQGAGRGGVGVSTTTSAPGGAGGGGGGGGHAEAGATGFTADHANADHVNVPRSQGGGTYGTDQMLTPTAGSGGGAGGYLDHSAWIGNDTGNATGGGGGAGGGFVDITAGGNITITGVIDASGGAGGDGIGVASGGNYLIHTGTGGGGSGGGIRLLTPAEMDISGATLTAAGGSHGLYPPAPYYQPITVNLGGNGGAGRIVLEDEDSIIQGVSSATLVPGEGEPGFYRNRFDPNRFASGSAVPVAVVGPIFVGPMSTPTFHTVTSDDFVCGIPLEATPGYGSTSIMVEARGYNLLTNGRADLSSETGWFTVGFFKESGSPDAPHWTGDTLPGDVSVQPDNSGVGFSTIGGPAFVQIRVSMYLPAGMSPTSPGPYMDSWEITFDHNQ